MSKDYLSIEITEGRINFVVGNSSLDGIHISKMFSIVNELLYIREEDKIDIELFVKDVKKILKAKKVRVKNTILTVSPKIVDVIEKTIEKVDESLIEEMVKLELMSDGIVIDNYEMQLIVEELPDRVNEGYKVKAYLLSKDIVQDALNALKKIGLKPCYFDINNNALSKLHNKILDLNQNHPDYTVSEREDVTVMYVDFSNASLLVNVMKGKKQEFFRLQENLIFNLLFNGDNSNKDIILERLVDSLEITNRYYKSIGIGNYIDEVYLYSFNQKYEIIEPLAKELSERLGANVNPLSTINGVLTGNIDEDTDISSYFNAINALIRN